MRAYLIPLFVLIYFLPTTYCAQENEKKQQLDELIEQISFNYNDSLSQAKDLIETAYHLSKEIKDTLSLARTSLYLGQVLFERRSFEEAEFYFNESINLSEKLNSIDLEVEGQMYLGELFFEVNDYENSLNHLSKCLSLLNIKNSSLRSRVYYDLAVSYNKLGQRKEALNYAFEVLKQKNIPPNILEKTYTVLAIIYGDVGDFEKAIEHLMKSIRLSEEHGNWKSSVKNYVKLAGYYKDFGFFEMSAKYFEQAIAIAEDHNYKNGLAYANLNYGGIYFREGLFGKAMKIYKVALKYYLELQDYHYLAFINNNIGEIFINTNTLDSAKIYINEALKYGLRSANKIALGYSYHSLGKIAIQENDYEEAAKYFKHSLQEEYIGITEQNYFQLSNIYDVTGKPDSALKYLRLKNEIKDSVFNSQTQKLFVDTGLKYEIEKKEEELRAVKAENENLSERFETSKNLTFFFVLGGVIIIGFVFYYYRNKTAEFIKKLKPFSSEANQDRRKLKKMIQAIDEISGNREEKQAIDENLLSDIITKLQFLVDTEKIFTNPKLTQTEVAKKLNTNTTYLSRAINITYDLNFSSFINKYRVEEAKKIIKEDKENIYTFEGIAQTVGFSSKSAFYTSFKKLTGRTPSQFAKEQKKS